jgi:hypothetical protein
LRVLPGALGFPSTCKPSLIKNNNYGLSRELDLIARENVTIDIFKF